MKHATFITEITVIDPDSDAPVELSVFKDQVSTGLFAVDSSFLVQEQITHVRSPFNPSLMLRLDLID